MSLVQNTQAGLSMVELLVALAISSFLIIGLSQVYIDHKRSYVFQQSQADNLENSRFAVFILDELLGKAGYRRAPDQRMSDAFPESTELSKHCDKFSDKSAITTIKAAANSGQTGFCLRYQPAENEELICDGSAAGLTHSNPFVYPMTSETVYVAILFKPHQQEANKGTLRCITTQGNMQLLEGIADLRFEFGSAAIESDTLTSTMSFKTTDSWNALDGPVRVVRYSVLAVSRNNQRDGDSTIYKQWLESASSVSKLRLIQQDNKQIYNIAMGTQVLRNMMP